MHACATHEVDDSMHYSVPAWLHRSVPTPTECLFRVLVPIRCCRSLTRSSPRWVSQKNPGETTRLWTARLRRARFPWTWLTWWSFSLACWRLEPLPNCALAGHWADTGEEFEAAYCDANTAWCKHSVMQSHCPATTLWCKHKPVTVRTPGAGSCGSTSKTQECEDRWGCFCTSQETYMRVIQKELVLSGVYNRFWRK